MARRRTLRPDEAELWQNVAKTARPMHPRPTAPKAIAVGPQKPADKIHQPAPALAPFEVGSRGSGTTVPSAAVPKPPRMDAKQFSRMVRGKTAPEARLDLHGMTLAEAHGELVSFVLGAHAAGHRLVLVITGKGKPGHHDDAFMRPIGVLRRQVPQWLRLAPLAPVILEVTTAHHRHGGEGALYVYLRRGR